MASRASSPGRSKEHQHAVGLAFLSAFQGGDLDECIDILHPDVEWHPSPKLLESEALRGRARVRHYLEALHGRFDGGPQVIPEDGRQIGEHLLMISVFTGTNAFNGTEVKVRECWVVTVRDDRWARVVCYPNGPVARLGFEELLRTGLPAAEAPSESAATDPSYADPPGDTLAPSMENATQTPAELANAAADGPAAGGGASSQITLSFTFQEAEALSRVTSDDAAANPALLKIRSAVDQVKAIQAVRHELEQAGVPTKHLSDQQVAQLGQRISQAAPRLGS
jgi:ketosteroid isomerase-like protein